MNELTIPVPELRQRVLTFEKILRESNQVVEIAVEHFFAHGIYARQIFIPKGTYVVGKIHRTEHLIIVSQGEISVVTPMGLQRIKAPHTAVAPAGAKECAYAHEDTVWTTFHATSETDLDKIESLFIAPSFEAITDISEKDEQKCLG